MTIVDNINKPFENDGQWDYWTFQKDVDAGTMSVFRNVSNGEGFNTTRPMGGDVEIFVSVLT